MRPEYRGMSVQEGVKHIESQYPVEAIKRITRFSDLHEISDANMALPFCEDVGSTKWLAFANAVIKKFNQLVSERREA